ncbi:hypothetical protein HaLaN_11834 [Haematococcus lacustris]|uniref:Uncharacterized protein n=1 Tax=Haematococcus lacustris TaxID=44745 RepID=A0A699Z9S5_HAELA|nr:hypothetical protein HaLaN_11834 [Haematococcus lacustris]
MVQKVFPFLRPVIVSDFRSKEDLANTAQADAATQAAEAQAEDLVAHHTLAAQQAAHALGGSSCIAMAQKPTTTLTTPAAALPQGVDWVRQGVRSDLAAGQAGSLRLNCLDGPDQPAVEFNATVEVDLGSSSLHLHPGLVLVGPGRGEAAGSEGEGGGGGGGEAGAPAAGRVGCSSASGTASFSVMAISLLALSMAGPAAASLEGRGV